MPRIGIIVEFRLKRGAHAAFDAIIREHARRTLEEEPGCERFDVFQPMTRDGRDEPASCSARSTGTRRPSTRMAETRALRRCAKPMRR